MSAKTEAEAFLKLQEAASIAIESVIGKTTPGVIERDAVTIFAAAARNTALPKLTLEVVAENEKLRELFAAMWKPINERRVHLIWRGTIARDLTDTEREELEQWQALASLMQNTLAPLPKALQEPPR